MDTVRQGEYTCKDYEGAFFDMCRCRAEDRMCTSENFLNRNADWIDPESGEIEPHTCGEVSDYCSPDITLCDWTEETMPELQEWILTNTECCQTQAPDRMCPAGYGLNRDGQFYDPISKTTYNCGDTSDYCSPDITVCDWTEEGMAGLQEWYTNTECCTSKEAEVNCYQEWWEAEDCTGMPSFRSTYDFSESQCIPMADIYGLEMKEYVTPTSRCTDSQCKYCTPYDNWAGLGEGVALKDQCYPCSMVENCYFKHVDCPTVYDECEAGCPDGSCCIEWNFFTIGDPDLPYWQNTGITSNFIHKTCSDEKSDDLMAAHMVEGEKYAEVNLVESTNFYMNWRDFRADYLQEECPLAG